MAANTTLEKREGPAQPETVQSGPFYRPFADIYELDKEYVVRADVPGARPDAIDVTYEQGLLTLHARVEPRGAGENRSFLVREYGVGDFHREFRIGEGIDAAGISAEYKDGVLTLHLPKAQETLPKRIQVNAG